MKITIFQSKLSGYAAACQRELKARGVELMVVHWPKAGNAPFDESLWNYIDVRIEKKGISGKELLEKVQQFNPDLVLMSGWMDKDYLYVSKKLKQNGVPIIASSDTPYKGNLRQKIASYLSGLYLKPSIDKIWVTGERQAELARQLGYTGTNLWTGFYACDWEAFAIEKPRRFSDIQPSFVFVGRFIGRKGLDTLLEAYKRYRLKSKNPWNLVTIGAGELEDTLRSTEGVICKGFIQPAELPVILQQMGAFVLPSKVEPWGVALQEAAAAGLPLIASDACGAGVHLIRDGFNGYVFETGNVADLEEKMLKISAVDQKQWESMSDASFQLSKQYTPALWAEKIIQFLKRSQL